MIRSGFMVIHGNRLELLRDLMINWIMANPLLPLETELFLVESKGMEAWLKTGFVENDKLQVSANFQMDNPLRFIWKLYRYILNEDKIPQVSVFDKSVLKWRILKLLPDLIDDDDFSALAYFLDVDDSILRIEELAEEITLLFDRYQTYRSDWLLQWQEGQDILIDPKGHHHALPKKYLWQAKLWRILVEDIGDIENPPFLLNKRVLDILTVRENIVGLPRRLVVFGVVGLSQQMIDVLSVLGKYCQVILCLHNPCQYYWGDIINSSMIFKLYVDESRKKQSTCSTLFETNTLLASLGKKARDFLNMVAQYDKIESYHNVFEKVDCFIDPKDEKRSLLTLIQSQIFNLESPSSTLIEIDDNDTSIEFRSTYSRLREIEVLQNVLLTQFKDNSNLLPHDVVVLCPNISDYTALIESVFGQFTYHDQRYIPYCVADDIAKDTDVFVILIDKLLSLDDCRFTLSEVLEWFSVSPLKQRFGLSDDDVMLLQVWLEESGVKWGLDATQRHQLLSLSDCAQNTWSFALDRLFLGYLVGDGASWQEISPCDGATGVDVNILGKLSVFIQKVSRFNTLFQASYQPTEWYALCIEFLETFFLLQEQNAMMIVDTIRQSLYDWKVACEQSDMTLKVPLSIVKKVCLSSFEISVEKHNFISGKVNFCRLMPMRAIPFKQIYILGMNDEDYPRNKVASDFDLIHKSDLLLDNGHCLSSLVRAGDSALRDDDCYLFLEALLSARERIYFSYIQYQAQDNTERAESVLLSQLKEYIANGFKRGDDIIDSLSYLEPLQPFSYQYMNNEELNNYVYEWFSSDIKTADKPLLSSEIDTEYVLQFRDFSALFRTPIEVFYRHRLHINLWDDLSEKEDVEPFALSPLDESIMKKQLFLEYVQGNETSVAMCLDKMRLSGKLPIGDYGEYVLEKVDNEVSVFYDRYKQKMAVCQKMVDQDIEYLYQAKATQLIFRDCLDNLYRNSEGVVQRIETNLSDFRQTMSKLKMSRLQCVFSCYIKHLFSCLIIGNVESIIMSNDSNIVFTALTKVEAQETIDELLMIYYQALHELLPTFMYSGYTYSMFVKDNKALELKKIEEAFLGSKNHQFYYDRKNDYISNRFQNFDQVDFSLFEKYSKLLYLSCSNAFKVEKV